MGRASINTINTINTINMGAITVLTQAPCLAQEARTRGWAGWWLV